MIPDKILFLGWIMVVEVMLFYAFHTLSYNPIANKRRFIPFKVGIIILFVLSWTGYGSGDYYNYYHVLGMIKQFTVFPSIEPAYWVIGKMVDYDNSNFRLLMSGVIYLGLYQIIKNYSVDKNITLSIFIIVYFLDFAAILRASLCDIIFYVGVLAFFKNRRWPTAILMILCTTSSLLFHKTAFILFIPLILCFFKFGRSTRSILIILAPILFVLSVIVTRFIFSSYFESSKYIDGSHTDGSRSAQINLLLKYLFWIGILLIGVLKTRRYLRHQGFYGFLSRMFFWYAYIGFILVLNPGSHYLFMRIVAHGCIPILLVLAYVFVTSTSNTRKLLRTALLIFILTIQISFYLMYTYNLPLLNTNQYIH